MRFLYSQPLEKQQQQQRDPKPVKKDFIPAESAY